MGRTGLSGAQAKKTVRGEDLRREREERGIGIRAGSLSGLAEEVPPAYKAVSRVVEVVQPAGLGRKLARLAPIAVTKGEQS
jgi:tRNA-splicing ligase RtcB